MKPGGDNRPATVGEAVIDPWFHSMYRHITVGLFAEKHKIHISQPRRKLRLIFCKTEKWWKFYKNVENHTKRIGTKSDKLADFIKRFWESCTKAELKKPDENGIMSIIPVNKWEEICVPGICPAP